MYSLIHLRFLVFKLHKIEGQRSFQIFTRVKILICSDFNEIYHQLFVLKEMQKNMIGFFCISQMLIC